MTDALRLGCIGGGISSAVGRVHMAASRMDGRWAPVAGTFSPEPTRNAASAVLWGVEHSRTHPTLHDFIAAETGRLDAVVVLTPTPSHEDHVAQLLNHGFNVICEKSLACSSGAATDLAALATHRGLFLAVTYNYTGYPMVRELQARIRAGHLGRLVAATMEYPLEGFMRVDASGESLRPQEWRRHDGPIPTVSLDLGTHAAHMLSFLLGQRPHELVSVQSHHGRVSGVADFVSCLARYGAGIDVQLSYGKCALGHRNGMRVRVYGEAQSAEWYQMAPEELRIADASAAIMLVDRASPDTLLAGQPRYERFKAGHPAGFIEAFANLYTDLADALLDFRATGVVSSPYVFGADSAAADLRVLEAIAASAETRAWAPVASQ